MVVHLWKNWGNDSPKEQRIHHLRRKRITPITTARMTPRVAMLAMIMAGLSTMSPYTNHRSKATETSPKVGKEMPSWR